jgi:hypothetical protein
VGGVFMEGFSVVSFLIVIVYLCFVIALTIPMVFGFIIIPKRSNKKILKVFLYGISILFIQVLILCLTTVLAKPYADLFNKSIIPNDIKTLIFSLIPLLLLIPSSLFVLKFISKIILEKKIIIFIWIQSLLLSFGITFATIITSTWLM